MFVKRNEIDKYLIEDIKKYMLKDIYVLIVI